MVLSLLLCTQKHRKEIELEEVNNVSSENSYPVHAGMEVV